MASASWKLCSMSGLQTPSASADDRSLSSSLMSPTSRCLSTPSKSIDPNGPADPTVVHGDVMLAFPSRLSVKRKRFIVKIDVVLDSVACKRKYFLIQIV